MFLDRIDAGRRLAELLRGRTLRDPLVLGVPNGGLVVAAEVARVLGAELDALVVQKLFAPGADERPIGATTETGWTYLTPWASGSHELSEAYLRNEIATQKTELARRQDEFRAARPRASLAGRSVIVVDDGLASGATMTAALKAARAERPCELIAAVPAAPLDALAAVREWCDDAACVLPTDRFWAVGQFYETFDDVPDARVVELLRSSAPRAVAPAAG